MTLRIKGKLLLISVGILVCITVAITLVSGVFFTSQYSQALEAKSFMIAKALKNNLDKLLKLSIPLNNLMGFEEQCQEVVLQYEDIAYAMVVDLDGKILFHSKPARQGERLADKGLLERVQETKEVRQKYLEGQTGYLGFVVPIFGTRNEHVGAVIIGYPADLISRKTQQMALYALGVALVFLLSGIFFLILALNVWVTDPLKKLLRVVKEISQKGTETASLVQIDSRDEIGDLGAAFNGMVIELRESQKKIREYTEELEAKVQESTAGLKQANARLQQDIVERIQTEEALRASEEKYRALLDNASDGILLADMEGNLLQANKKIEEMTGYDQRELVARQFPQIYLPEEQERGQSFFQEVVRQGAGILTNSWILTKDGAEIPVDISAGVVRYEGQTLVQSIFRDMSLRQKVEEERLKISNLESLGILAGGIAHDFNNLLTAIIGNISLAQLEGKPEAIIQVRLLEAEKACGRAQILARQLLTFAKGGAPIRRQRSLTELLRNSGQLTLSGSSSRLEMPPVDDLWLAEVDEGQLTQVFNNLFINALQAMPEGGAITVRAENVALGKQGEIPLPEGKYVKICISDQGVGIEAKYLGKIFDPYFTTKTGASGLGLTTAYSIIKNHAGYLAVASKAGGGTTLSLYLPAVAARDSQAPGPAGRALGQGQGKILVMDDDEAVKQVLGKMLSMLGYEVGFAQDGEEAVNIYRQAKESGQPFAATILDLTIPGGMGGKEAIKRLLHIDQEVKAIVSSGYADDPIMAGFMHYGFKGVMPKPYKVRHVGQVLQTVLTSES